MVYVRKSPEQLEMEKEVEVEKISTFYLEKDKERQQELELAKIDLEKAKLEITISNRAMYTFKVLRTVFDTPVKIITMFYIGTMVLRKMDVPRFLQRYLNGEADETKK